MSHAIEHYHGLITPMVSPFTARGQIDQEVAARLMTFLLEAGANPFVLGTTGEVSSIPVEEREVLVKLLLQQSPAHLPNMAGVVGLPYADTVRVANRYLELGVDAVVVTLPNFFLLTEQQMLLYFEQLSREIDGNIILYNIPKTIHMSIPLKVLDELSYRENIIGIKDSEPNAERLVAALKLWKDRKDFSHFVGTNSLMCQGLLLGSKGIVPSTANLFPQQYREMIALCRAKEVKKAEELHALTGQLSAAYQEDSLLGESLAALKVILTQQGICTPYMLPPLSRLTGRAEKALKVKWEKMVLKQQSVL
ncbi:MAG: dihydrodipicolinate synthase family protein [Tunicatimonas sp.]